MSDKFKTTFPIDINFTRGEQPTDTKLTALAKWARNGMRAFEELIGDLRGGDSNIPWNSTGNPQVSIKSNKRTKSDGDTTLADDFHAYNQIVSLARLIGPAGLLNPQVESGSLSEKSQQGNGCPLEEGVCLQVLPFKPYDIEDIEPSDFVGTSVFTTRVSSPEGVTAAHQYHVTPEGILYTGSTVPAGVTLRYSYTTEVGDSYIGAKANVIPGPGSYEKQPGSGPGWMCRVRYDSDLDKWVLISPERKVGHEALFNSGIELSQFESSHDPIYAIPNLDQFPVDSTIVDNYYLLWDHETSTPLYNVKFKKIDGSGGFSGIYVLELIAPSSFTNSLVADDGVTLLKDSPWTSGSPGAQSTRRFSLLAPGTQITALLSQLRLEMKTHSHDGNGSEPIDHKYIVGGLTEHIPSRRNGFIYSVIRGNVHPQYLHRHGFRGGGSYYVNEDGPTADGYINDEDPGNASNAFLGDLVIGPINRTNPRFNPGDPEAEYDWNTSTPNKSNPISHRLIFGWPSLNKDVGGSIKFGSIRRQLDYSNILPLVTVNYLTHIDNSDIFGSLVDESTLQNSKGILFENTNVFLNSGDYTKSFVFQKDNEDTDVNRLVFFSQRWRNLFHTRSKTGFSGIAGGLAGVFSVAYSGEVEDSPSISDYNEYLYLPGLDNDDAVDKSPNQNFAAYRPGLFSEKKQNRPKHGGFNYLYAGGVLGTGKNNTQTNPPPPFGSATEFDEGRLVDAPPALVSSHPLRTNSGFCYNNWYGANVLVSSYGDKYISRRFSHDIVDNFDDSFGYSADGFTVGDILSNRLNSDTVTLFSENEHWGPLRKIANKHTSAFTNVEIGGIHRFNYKVKEKFERFGLLGLITLTASDLYHGEIGSWNTSRQELERPFPEDMGAKLNGLNTIEVFNGISFSPEADYHSEFVLKSNLVPQWPTGEDLRAANEGAYTSSLDGSMNYPNAEGIELINKFLYNENATQGDRGPITKKHYAFGFNVQSGGASNFEAVHDGAWGNYYDNKDPFQLVEKVFKPADAAFEDNLLVHNFEDPYSSFRTNFTNSESNVEIQPALWIDQVLRSFAYENNIDFNREVHKLQDLIDSFNVYLVPRFTSDYYEMGQIRRYNILEPLDDVIEAVHTNGIHIPVDAKIIFQPVRDQFRIGSNSSFTSTMTDLNIKHLYNDLIAYDNSFRTTSMLRSNDATGDLNLCGIEWTMPFVEIPHQYITGLATGAPNSTLSQKVINDVDVDRQILQGDRMLYRSIWDGNWSIYMGSSLRSPDLITELMRRRFILEALGIAGTELVFEFKVDLKIKSRYRRPRAIVNNP